jgi:hypothetical protein
MAKGNMRKGPTMDHKKIKKQKQTKKQKYNMLLKIINYQDRIIRKTL